MNPVFVCWVLLTLGAHRSSCEGESLLSQVEDCGKVDAIAGDKRTRAPWLAGIMWRVTGELLMAGTIVDRYTILTVFGGDERLLPLENKNYSLYSEEYMVAVGLLSADPIQADEHTQMEQVSNILPYEEDDPKNIFFLFKLRNPLKMGTPYVRSACLPLYPQHLPNNDDGQELQAVQGTFVHIDSSLMNQKKELHVIDFRLKNKAFCDEKAGFSKSLENYLYCGQVSPNQRATCHAVGSAAVTLLYKSRWFVIGIHVVYPRPPMLPEFLENAEHPVIQRSWCTECTIFYYGRLLKAKNVQRYSLEIVQDPPHFILDEDKVTGSGPVILPNTSLENTRFSGSSPVLGATTRRMSEENGIEARIKRDLYKNTEISDFRTVRKSLAGVGRNVPSGTLSKPDNTEFSVSSPLLGAITRSPSEEDEIAGSDPTVPSGALSKLDNTEFSGSSPLLGATTRCPPPPTSEGVVANCTAQDNTTVSCDQASPGISAILECQPYYVSTYPLPTTRLKCGGDGTWKSLGFFGCKAQCGIIQNKNLEAYIAYGQPTSKDMPFPWHAAVFLKDRNGFYKFICGASLIERNVAVTAAHCTRGPSGKSLLHQGLKIALGGNSSTFEVNEKRAEVQVFNINKIMVPATYNPFTLQSDIALIWLERGAVYNDHVRPVCYRLQDSLNIPSAGTLGKVAGYGYTTEQKLSEHLQQASFPVVAPADCLSALRSAPAFGTFCAGYRNGTSVCPGDSGGGMVFLDEGSRVERYVLKGVVSRGDGSSGGRICDPNNYAVFTHVDTYRSWILQNIFS